MHTPKHPNPISRRGFLGRSAAASALLLAQARPGAVSAAPAEGETSPPLAQEKRAPKHPIGLELYSVRSELMRDSVKTLRAVAGMGYEVVEFYSPYFDWSIPHAKEVRTLLDDIGLRCYSTHNSYASFTPGKGMSKAIELNQILGTRQMILASAPGSAKGIEGWKQLCGRLTSAVDELKPHGLAAGFHNHQTEWAILDGNQSTMDVIAENTPKEFVLQLDVGTCVEAGADPVAWVKAHPGRIRSMHLKDWAPGEAAQEKSFRVLFGEGVSPWKELIAAAESVGGVEHYLLEQEGSRFSEFETARRCLENWKKFRG